MSATALPEHHVVTVTMSDDLGWPFIDSVVCECSAPDDAPCRTYPDCGCEFFTKDPANPDLDTSGHPYITGRDCWVTQWFDADPSGEATIFVGPAHGDEFHNAAGIPLVAHTGHIDIVGFDEAPEWQWAS